MSRFRRKGMRVGARKICRRLEECLGLSVHRKKSEQRLLSYSERVFPFRKVLAKASSFSPRSRLGAVRDGTARVYAERKGNVGRS